MFSTSSCGFATWFRHAFDFFCRKPGREPAASISTYRDWCSRFAACSLVRARARQMECRKNPFQASQQNCWSWIFVTCFIFVLIMMQLSEKKRCRRAWFYTQKRYKLHPRWIHVMGHIMHQRPSWNYCTYRLISLAFTSRSTVLYASYLCLFLIYCSTHVECFPFLLGR